MGVGSDGGGRGSLFVEGASLSCESALEIL